MTVSIVLEFAVVLAAIWMGARTSGLGLWGALGLLVLIVVFGVSPTSPPIDVMLIILAVIMAASVMDAAGGIDFLVQIARAHHPRQPEIRARRVPADIRALPAASISTLTRRVVRPWRGQRRVA